jgi:LEA14-like dessication related protein
VIARRVPSRLVMLAFGLAALGSAGCADLLGGLRSIQKPSARVTGVHLDGLSLRDVTLAFDVEVSNPYGVDLPLLDLGYDLTSGGSDPFLEGTAPLGGSVPPKASKTVSLPVRVDFLRTIDLVENLRPGQVVPYRASLVLSVDPPGLGPLSLPLSSEGTFPIPDVPEVRSASIQWSQLSLSRVEGRVALDLANPNAFAVQLTDLSYSLDLAGTTVSDGGAQPSLSIPAGSSQRVELPLAFSPTRLGAALYDVVTASQAPYELRADLSVTTPFGPLDVPLRSVGEARLLR